MFIFGNKQLKHCCPLFQRSFLIHDYKSFLLEGEMNMYYEQCENNDYRKQEVSWMISKVGQFTQTP